MVRKVVTVSAKNHGDAIKIVRGGARKRGRVADIISVTSVGKSRNKKNWKRYEVKYIERMSLRRK